MDTTIETGPAAGNERLVYSVAETGALLGISRAFAYELVARGEIPVIRLGRRRLVPKAALIAFVGLDAANEADAMGLERAAVDVHKGVHTAVQRLGRS
jgi:excisionase family DNA binding protein